MESDWMEKSNDQIRGKILRIISLLLNLSGICLLAYFLYYANREGIFRSEEKMAEFIQEFGSWAPFVVIFYLALQVVIPMLPSEALLIINPFLFGNLRGFLISYVGILIGSALAFLVSKRYGIRFLDLFLDKRINRFFDKIRNSKHFNRNIMLAYLIPGPPDDYLTYFAGTSPMSLKTFMLIIIPCKIPNLILYNFGFCSLISFIMSRVH
jgi:uncharacterized membrane protein YdjX (TVP38/TMEM64 family)